MDHLAGNFLKRTLSLPHSSPLWIFWEWIPHGVQHDPLPANLSSSFAARMHLAFSYNPPPPSHSPCHLVDFLFFSYVYYSCVQPVFLVPLCFALQHVLCIKNVPPLSDYCWCFFVAAGHACKYCLEMQLFIYFVHIFALWNIRKKKRMKEREEEFKAFSIKT